MRQTHFTRRSVATAAILLVVATVGVAVSNAAAATATPPNGIYTCAWIAVNPAAAAQAQVTCDPAVFFAAMSAGSAVISPESQVACEQIPLNGGRVGTGVFAWGQYYGATYWGYGAQWSPPVSYTWYVQRIDGYNAMHGDVSTLDWYTTPSVPWSEYRWGAQNHGSLAQSWQECSYQ